MAASIDMKNSEPLLLHTIFVFSTAAVFCLISFFFFDQTISIYLSTESLVGFRRVCRVLTDLGEAGPYFLCALGVYAASRWLGPCFPLLAKQKDFVADARRASLLLFVSLLEVGLFAQILKIIIGRQRPHKTATFENWHFVPFSFHWHWHSFPSGHSQLVFTVATAIGLIQPRLRWPAFFLAAIVAFTRVATHDHFVSDVIAGSTIGYLGTLWVHHWFVAKWPLKT